MPPLVQLKDCCKYFQVPAGTLHAVDHVNLSIKAGETLGVVGESGCGKSTLGRVILRLHEPTSGHIYFDGMDLTRFNEEEMRRMRREMQIIFQDPYASLNPRMTIAQIIGEPLEVNKLVSSRADQRKKVEALMEQVGLARRTYNLYPHEFDGGRRQRVVIARALAVNPRFIVCDEPVSALDVSVQAQVLNLLMELQSDLNLTYMFISHDLSVIHHISDNVAVMYLGQIVEQTSQTEIFRQPLHPYTKLLLSAIPNINPFQKMTRTLLKGELTSPINPGTSCRFASRCAYADDKCRTANPCLEELEPGHFVACFRAKELAASYTSPV